MDLSRLHGLQYVCLAPGAAEAMARYLDVTPDAIGELALDLQNWPEEIHPTPRRARDGRLIAGDPLLLDAGDDGLLFARDGTTGGKPVLVPWADVRLLDVLNALPERLRA
jgi:hypothetical protein